MSYDNLKQKLSDKEEDNRRRKDITLRAFEAIKRDCLHFVIDKTIERNFECGVSLPDITIIDFVCEKLGYQTRGYKFDCSIGVGNYLRVDYLRRFHEERMGISKSGEEDRLLKDIDYKLLSVLICNYIKSKGFKSRRGTHRYTGKDIELMEFTIDEYKLKSLVNSGSSEELNKSSGDITSDNITVLQIVVCTLTIVAIILLYCY